MNLLYFFNNIKKNTDNLNYLSVGIILGLRTFLGTIALTTLLAQSAHITVASLLPNIMLGVIVSCLLVSMLSHLPQSIVQPQDGPAIILSTLIASATSHLPNITVSTVFLIHTLSCISAGCALYVIGKFKLGNAARLLPYPVIGGFLAGSGMLMLIFALKPIAQIMISTDYLTAIEQSKSVLTSLIFALFTIQINKKIRGAMAMPMAAILFSILINFYIVSASLSPTESIQNGWLLDFNTDKISRIEFPNYHEYFQQIHLIFGLDWTEFLGIAVVSVVSFLLIQSSIELTIHKEIDINHELKIAGISNLISSFFGGLISYTALSATLLAFEKEVNNRKIGFTVAVVCSILMFANLNIIFYIPRPVINGILILMGYGLVKEWIFKNYSRLGFYDYLSILVIAFSIVILGYIGGILVGIVISVIMFVLRYSRIKIIKHELTASDIQSRVVRPQIHSDYIKNNGSKIRILKLDGYLFFGSVHAIFGKVINLIEVEQVSFIILDFSLVESVDLAAVETINRSAIFAIEHKCDLLIAGASLSVFKIITKSAIFFSTNCFYQDVDHALEFCENKLLADHYVSLDLDTTTTWLHADDFDQLLHHMHLVEYRIGASLFNKGEKSSKIFILSKGVISIKVTDLSGRETRVQTLLAGSIIGERSFISQETHSATAIAEVASEVYELSRENYELLSSTHPKLIQLLNYRIIITLSDRLLSADHLISLLMTV